ncbi:MAG: type II toxin-antitoxin system VapC family toxin [Spirulinaceae cyanobacterium]
MIQTLLDTNIILDVLLDRDPFVEAASQLFQALENKKFQGYVAAITLNNLFYIIRKLQGQNPAYDAIERILTGMEVCPVTQQTLSQAFELKYPDFEDAIQTVCALEQNLPYIVTRNSQDFSHPDLQVLSPSELLALL